MVIVMDCRVMNDLQKQKMANAIFSNKEVLDQLNESSSLNEYIEDDTEALRIINEARDGQ